MSGHAPDPQKLEAFMHKMVGDMGAIMSGALILLGDHLGIFKSMAEIGKPVTSGELAAKTGLSERYLREWLAAMAAGGYVGCDPKNGRFWLDPEQAAVLSDDMLPTYMAGGLEVAASAYIDEPKIANAFRTGKGVGWHEHHACLFRGTERFFRPGYRANLIGTWLPSLTGVTDMLKKGAKVGDVGCGHGASTIIMAEAFPNSQFVGFDYHDASIRRARELAAEAGLKNATFEVAKAQDFKGDGFDLIACFDCLHDMGDPVGAARRIKSALKPGGKLMLVEPFANDELADNLNPIGRLFYAASTMICTPASLSQEVGLGLGAQAGQKRLTEVLKEGGFSNVRRATETPFNLILEAT